MQYIVPNAIVVSDCWLAYATLNSIGYRHFEVNHSYGFSDPLTGYNTNSIESCWKHTKKATISAGGCSDDDLQLKLDMYAFRSMYLKSNPDKAFLIVSKAIAQNWHFFQ